MGGGRLRYSDDVLVVVGHEVRFMGLFLAVSNKDFRILGMESRNGSSWVRKGEGSSCGPGLADAIFVCQGASKCLCQSHRHVGSLHSREVGSLSRLGCVGWWPDWG